MKLLTSLLVTLLLLGGCAMQKDTNKMIAKANTDRYTAFTKGMNESKSEGARIAMAMAFASNMGVQEFYRERDAVDYINAAGNLIAPWVPFLMSGSWEGDRSSSSIEAGRDVYVNSTRSDTTNTVNSAVQKHLFNGDNNSTSSSDQPFIAE